MAEAIYNKYTNSNSATSVGTYVGSPDEPEGQLLANLFKDSPYFFEIMENNGMDVRQKKTKKLLPEMLHQADRIVSMAEEPFIPDFLKNNKKVVWWEVKNPQSVTKDVAQKTYEQINGLVQKLIKDEISIKI